MLYVPPELIPVAAVAVLFFLILTGALAGLLIRQAKSDGEGRAVNSIRDELARRLPGFVQPLVTSLTGAAPSGSEPFFSVSRGAAVTLGLFVLFAGVALTNLMFGMDLVSTPTGLFGISFGMVLTTGGARALLTTTLHYAAHHIDAERRKRKDRDYKDLYFYYAVAVAFLLQTQPVEDYLQDHMAHHRSPVFGRERDPDYRFLLSLGFDPGMPTFSYWMKYLGLLFSPWFHIRFALARLDGRVATRRGARSTTIYWATVLAIGYLFGWPLVMCAWLVPLFPLLHMAALTQFTSEHRWGLRRDPSSATNIENAKLTSARYCADAPPPEDLPFVERLVAWAAWWYRLFTLHLVCRLAVVPQDLVHHDLHHHFAFERLRSRHDDLPAWCEWVNSAHARHIYESRRRPTDPPCTEIWGIPAALSATFECWSTLPAPAQEPSSPAEVNPSQA